VLSLISYSRWGPRARCGSTTTQPAMLHKLPQVLGLTNYSRWADAGALRACAAADEPAAARLQAAALARLRALAHVGLTERLEESIASLAASLGLRMDGPAWKVCWHRSACYM